MSREYKAFISYRHLPLDMWTAKSIHRRIEHYIIPKNLRKDGKKKLGYVFRDQDELPISCDLTASIREALDHSEFLIVICTPETEKSLWVLEEINYFLSHHDHDHVLAVLADGAGESFPLALREIRSADGELIDTIEPMAANIAADSAGKRRRLFRTESLRILAALIGCAYDDLYRREQRYRLRRLALAMALITALTGGFIGMLLNRNAEIRENFEQAQRNQSQYLASESLKALGEGDRLKAISLAIEALPTAGHGRPRVSKAEYALGCAVGAYLTPGQAGSPTAVGMLSHANTVTSFERNADATLLCSLCEGGTLVGWDLKSLQELWSFPADAKGIAGFLNDSELLAWSHGELYCLNGATGEKRWSRSIAELSFERFDYIARVWICGDSREVIVACPETILVVDSTDGAVLRSLPWPKETAEGERLDPNPLTVQVSPDGCLLSAKCSTDKDGHGIIVVDLQDGSIRLAQFYYGASVDCHYAESVAFLGDCFFYCSADLSGGSSSAWVFGNVLVRSENVLHCVDLNSGEILWETRHSYTAAAGNEMLRCDMRLTGKPLLAFAYANRLDVLDPESGELLAQTEFSSPLVGLDIDERRISCVMESGEHGYLMPNDFSQWFAVNDFVDDLVCGRTQDRRAWVLQRGSGNIVCYDLAEPDPNWIELETVWATRENKDSFRDDEQLGQPGCIALLDRYRLLVGDGGADHPLRELRLPCDTEFGKETEYSMQAFVDGQLCLSFNSKESCGAAYVDPAAASYRIVSWPDQEQKLIGLRKTKDALGWVGLGSREETSGDESLQRLTALLLDKELRPQKTLELGSFSGLTEQLVRFDPSGLLYVYLPDMEKTLCADFVKGQVRECGDRMNRAFAAMHANGEQKNGEIAFSPDSSHLALLTGPGECLVMNKDGESLYTLQSESRAIRALAFSPDGRYLLSVESDSFLRRYRAADGQLLGRSELYPGETVSEYARISFCFTSSGFLALRVNSVMNLISTADWGTFAYVPSCFAYLEDRDVFLCYNYGGDRNTCSCIPRYTLESLVDYGQRILNGWELDLNQRMQYGLD